jgi:hypothetical protein
LKSALAVPIMTEDRAIGVLSFYACELNAFDDAHRRLVAAASLAVAPSLMEIGESGRIVSKATQNSTHVLRN